MGSTERHWGGPSRGWKDCFFATYRPRIVRVAIVKSATYTLNF
jgi:hypothetical protein